MTIPVIDPHESFVLMMVESDSGTSFLELTQAEVDLIINESSQNLGGLTQEDAGCRIFLSSGVRVTNLRVEKGAVLYLFKILNESVHPCLKPITDPVDFQIIDMVGDWSQNPWHPTGDSVTAEMGFSLTRKPEYWQGDTLFGIQGSWGNSQETSEWTLHKGLFTNELNVLVVFGRVARHTFAAVTAFNSTVTSIHYKVSRSYLTTQSIEGVEAGTFVSLFFENMDKAHEVQELRVKGKSGSDIVAASDILIVTSAMGGNVTKYAIETGALNDDAVLNSGEYAIDHQGNEGSLSGIPVGTSIQTVREQVTLPEVAILNVINDQDELVPLQVRNYDSTYVNTPATGYIYFEAIAEDGTTKIVYRLKLDIADDETYMFSDVYDVDQSLRLITPLPDGTKVQAFFRNCKPNVGAKAFLVDKIGLRRPRGDVKRDDQVVVTSANGKRNRIYNLKNMYEPP